MAYENKTTRAMLRFEKDFGVKPTSQGQYAVRNRKAYDNIVRGTAHRATEEKIMAWIKEQRKERAVNG